jgi:hypothetical protein
MISVVAAGCDPHTGPGEPGLDLRIGTDRLEYSLSSDSAVYVALVNTGVDTVYMWAPSFNRRLEIWRHFEWRDLGPWYLIVAGGFVLVPVVPGDSLPDDVPLPLASEIIPGPGLYRFAFTVYRDPDLTELLPVALRVSNVFKLVD